MRIRFGVVAGLVMVFAATAASAEECKWTPAELVEVDLGGAGNWQAAMVKTIDTSSCVAEVIILRGEGQAADDTPYTVPGSQIRLMDVPIWAFGDGN